MVLNPAVEAEPCLTFGAVQRKVTILEEEYVLAPRCRTPREVLLLVHRPVKRILIELFLLGFGEHIVQVLNDKFFRTLEAGASQWENSFLHFFLDVILKAARVENVLAV